MHPSGTEVLQCKVQKTDGVSEIPYDRWDVDEYFDPSPNAVGRMYVRHAAFIQNADCFDAMLFGISGAEAARGTCDMDGYNV